MGAKPAAPPVAPGGGLMGAKPPAPPAPPGGGLMGAKPPAPSAPPGGGLMGAKPPAPPAGPPRPPAGPGMPPPPPTGGQEPGSDAPAAGPDVNTVIQPLAERLLAEVRRSLEYYTSQEDGVPVTKVYITGGAAKLGGLKEFLAARLNLEIIELEALGNAKISSPPENPGAYQSCYGVGQTLLSTAPVTLNLLPSDLLQSFAESSRGVYKRYATLLAILLVGEAGAYGWFAYSKRKAQVEELRAKYEGQVIVDGKPLLINEKPVLNKEVLDRIAEIQKRRDQLDERFKAIRELETSKYDWIAMMEAIRRSIPEKAWLTNAGFDFTAAGITLNLRTTVEDNARIFYKNVTTSTHLSYAGTGINLRRERLEGVDYWSWDAPLTYKFQPAGSLDDPTPSEAATAETGGGAE